jgi:hypothetical protein
MSSLNRALLNLAPLCLTKNIILVVCAHGVILKRVPYTIYLTGCLLTFTSSVFSSKWFIVLDINKYF